MADTSQYFKPPGSDTTYTSYDAYTHNINGATPLPITANTYTAPNPTNPPNIPPPQVMGDATTNLATAQTNYLDTLKSAPSSYDLYQKELKTRGIDTLAKQESQLGQLALEQEKALRPLLPENVAFNFPKSMQQLQEIGVTQSQLNLLAAKERAPIAQGLSDLLRSQSLIAQRIDRQTEFSRYAVQLRQADFQNKAAAAELQYNMAKDNRDFAFETEKEARDFAIENGVTSQFYNLNGTVVRSSDGKRYSTPEQFFKDAGVSSFEQAAGSGILTTISGQAKADKEAVLDLRSKYPDAGISSTDTFAQASAKLKTSRIYQDQIRGPVGTTTTPMSKEEARVKQIIAIHPGEWGNAADQIDAEFGAGTATKYNDLLKAAFDPNTIAAAKKAITPEIQAKINDAKAAIDFVKQQYGDWESLRQQIIEQEKANGVDLSPFI